MYGGIVEELFSTRKGFGREGVQYFEDVGHAVSTIHDERRGITTFRGGDRWFGFGNDRDYL